MGPINFPKENEEFEKPKAKEHYMKLYLVGKIEQAKGDLTHLATIRKQLEEQLQRRISVLSKLIMIQLILVKLFHYLQRMPNLCKYYWCSL